MPSKIENRHLLFATTLPTVIKLLWTNKVSPRYFFKALKIVFIATIRAPFRLQEKIKIDNQSKNQKIYPEPVFIIGHWRTGTTLLHNLLVNGLPDYGYISSFNSYGFPYTRIISKRFREFSSKRPMDNMVISNQTPEEEEFAHSAYFTDGYYHGWSFPQELIKSQKVLLSGEMTREEKQKWEQNYLYILRKISKLNSGKPLLLKNPANTARIDILLELFPKAKFVHITRNPSAVYASTLNLYKKFKFLRLNDIFDHELSTYIIETYQKQMGAYISQVDEIPKGQLFEIKYEDLENNMLGSVTEIVQRLSLANFKKDGIERFIEGQEKYTKNNFQLDAETLKLLDQSWGSIYDHFKYTREVAI